MSRLSLFALGIVTVALSAQAEEWDKRYTVSGVPELRVETGDGNIELRPGRGGEIHARVVTRGYRIGEDGIRIIESQSGGRVDIQIRFPREWGMFNLGNRWVRVELTVPDNLTGVIRTGDGNITGKDVGGDLRASTGDGNIELDDFHGSLDANTGDGRIRVGGKFDRLSVRTGDGSVETRVDEGSRMAASWRVGTGDGSVTLHLPASFAADLDLRTGDGDIHCDMPVSTVGSVRENRLRGKINGGGQLLTVSTGDGSIRVGRL